MHHNATARQHEQVAGDLEKTRHDIALF